MAVSVESCTRLIEVLPVLALLKRDVRSGTSAQLIPALPALSVLAVAGDIRPSDLAERLSVDTSVASRQVASLVALGLVERHPDPADHRAHRLRLTDAGRSRLEEIRDSVARRISSRLSAWDEADLSALTDLLERLGATIRASDDCSPGETSPARPLAAPEPADGSGPPTVLAAGRAAT
ncbi:MarR family winged helix-turn-helix transcriptional regulator [Nakamurella endophytica]|uniref:HTH marR-type domain-containing protein n=1 Tax=Nakamurella endophytica TaxID=1748367 RepID=A0A917SVI1_9ACTN|nr:MarR family winged helix-turn-helix transcriptional regulator [Nakamurella endophytica]GGM00905.1 hypothetical protein GCM10011594_21180 [Nakamurella endophytica]